MLFPIGMQFLTVGEEYEIGLQSGYRERYMLGDLDEVVRQEGGSLEWTPAVESMKVVPGETCRFRVQA